MLDTSPKNERDRHTDRQTHTHTQTPHDGIGRAYASHRAAKTKKIYLRREKVPVRRTERQTSR